MAFFATPFVPDPAVYAPTVKIPFTRLGRPTFENAVNTTPSRLALATLTVGIPLPSVESQESLALPGACPALFDGVQVHEEGFNYYPEAAFVSDVVGDGVMVAGGTYGFVFVFEWQDAKGKMHRSAPSVPISRALSGVTDTALFRVSPMLLTEKQGADSIELSSNNIRIVCYRTTNGGTTYYRDSMPTTVAALPLNLVSDALYSSLLYTGGLTDAQLVASELLYTTGGALENEAFPSSSIVCAHQRRRFTVRQDGDQSFVQFTEESDDSFLAVATNETYRIAVPRDGGSVVGLASMDEKLIILCQHRIYFVYGEGPNRLGQQNSYSLPQLCSAKLGALGGCQDALALTPDGLWFMSSARGLRMLTRGLQIAAGQDGAHLGTEADGLLPNPITKIRAVSVDDKEQVRWYFGEEVGFVVSYDYQQQLWSKFTNHDSRGGAVSARGLFWHASASALYYSSATPGTPDAGTNTPALLETAWIALDGLQGYQRVYSMMLLLQTVADTTLTLEVGYDYVEAYAAAQVFSIAATTLNPLQLDHRLTQQKCTAVRFRLTWSASAESIRLTAMSLSVGVKGGLNKMSFPSQPIG